MSTNQKMSALQKFALFMGGLVLLDFIKGFINAISERNWDGVVLNVISLSVLLLTIYLLRSQLKQGWNNILKHREASRDEFEKNQGNINIRDAAIFSLAWSKEIYQNIPEDRKPLVKTSFTLIGFAMAIVVFNIRNHGLLGVLLIGGLILAGVNLLIWVVSSERQEKERIAIELETARKMQLSLMPAKDPEVSGFDISGCCIPALNVGGDLFDFVWSGKEKNYLCIPVVDVSGKGMDAALTAVYTSGALVSEAQHQEDLVTVMDNLNAAILSRHHRSRFVSLLMVALDVVHPRLDFINAGQSKPLLLRNDEISVLKGEGPRFPLGVMKAPNYRQQSLTLKKGDTLLFFTDGVTEAMNENQEMFGNVRLNGLFIDLVRRGIKAKDMVTTIKNQLHAFAGKQDQYDDITIVIVKVI